MSKWIGLLSGGVTFLAVAIAIGGEPGPIGWLKALLVGIASGAIVMKIGVALDKVTLSLNDVEAQTDELRKGAFELPALHEFEIAVRKQGSSVGARRVAEHWSAQLAAPVEFARWLPTAAVSAGIAGTLTGILLACLGLHLGKGDSASIVTLANWCGGSLICAVVGCASSAFLTVRLSQFDSGVRTLSDLAENHAAELLAQNSFSDDGRLAELIGHAVSQSFVQAGDIWDSLRLTSKEIQQGSASVESASAQLLGAVERLTEQTEISNRVAWQLDTTATNIAETAKTCSESGRLLEEIFSQLLPVFKNIQVGMDGLNRSLGSLYPALESARDLQLTIKAADLVFQNIDSRVAGMARSIHDEVKSASDQMLLNQQSAFTQGVAPPLKTIAHTMDLLLLLIDRSEQLLRNLPLAVPAKRIVDDLSAAGAAHLAGAERDAKTVVEVSHRLEDTETRMNAVLEDLKSAHAQIAESLQELRSETAAVARQVEEVSAHMEGPFWKKLGARKP